MNKREVHLRPAAPGRGVLQSSIADGMLRLHRVQPSSALAPFVHHVWAVRWSLRAPFAVESLPFPAARIELREESGLHHGLVAGVPRGLRGGSLSGEGQMLGIAFRPAMIQPLVGGSMASLTGRERPIGSLLGAAASAWVTAVLSAVDLDHQLACVEAFLVPRLATAGSEVLRWRDLTERMDRDRALLRVADAAHSLGVSPRVLQQGFRWYVGVSPKWALQRYRLLDAVEQLKGSTPPALADLAVGLGFADQAHFTRAFKTALGRTPQAFLRQQAARGL